MQDININFLGLDCVAFFNILTDDCNIELDRLECNNQVLDVDSLAVIPCDSLQRATYSELFIIELIKEKLLLNSC